MEAFILSEFLIPVSIGFYKPPAAYRTIFWYRIYDWLTATGTLWNHSCPANIAEFFFRRI